MTQDDTPSKKPPNILFYCKTCSKLGRQKDFLMPVKDMPGHPKGISIHCIHCLHDQGYRFKGLNYGKDSKQDNNAKHRKSVSQRRKPG